MGLIYSRCPGFLEQTKLFCFHYASMIILTTLILSSIMFHSRYCFFFSFSFPHKSQLCHIICALCSQNSSLFVLRFNRNAFLLSRLLSLPPNEPVVPLTLYSSTAPPSTVLSHCIPTYISLDVSSFSPFLTSLRHDILLNAPQVNQQPKPTMAAARRSSVARRSSAANPGDFAHPYLATAAQPSKPKRRELGLCNLFLFKVCGCFSGDELPPPNFEAPIYQAAKSSSSTFTFNTNTTTTPTASRTHSPSKHTALSTTTTNTTNTATTTATAISRASSARYGIIGATGVEDIPYRRPPPEQQAQAPRHKPRNDASPGGAPRSFSKSAPPFEGVSTANVPRNRASDAWESRAPVELAESDELETRKIVGNVSRLSAMFDQEE